MLLFLRVIFSLSSPSSSLYIVDGDATLPCLPGRRGKYYDKGGAGGGGAKRQQQGRAKNEQTDGLTGTVKTGPYSS
jgi:hypothetical protein